MKDEKKSKLYESNINEVEEITEIKDNKVSLPPIIMNNKAI